jgi:ABC-type multidrug transport system fused ATPase/permease subunit
MTLKQRIASLLDLLRKLRFLVQPYGSGKALFVLLVVLLQALLQVAGVTSVFPFLALASDPDSFRASALGARVLDYLPPMTNQQLLMWSGLLSIGVLILSNAANLLSDYVRARYAQGLGHWLRLRLLRRMASRPWGYFLGQNTAILLKKTTWDVNNMIGNVVLPLLEGFARLLTAVFLTATLVVISPGIAIFASLILTAYYVVVFAILRKPRHRLSEALRAADRGAFQDAQQLLAGIKTVKLYGVERFFLERFARHSLTQALVNCRATLYYHFPKYVLEPIAFGGVILAVLLFAARGEDLGQIIPVLGVAGLAGYRLLPAMQLLYTQMAQIATNRHTLEEVFNEFTGDADHARKPLPSLLHGEGRKPMRFERAIQLENVAFSYSDGGKPVLRDLDITLPKHASVGIVGKTGSGKSTLIDILMGLHVPVAGRVVVDGISLSAENVSEWQAGIGYVPQEIFLIDDTVARNIALGVPDDEIDLPRLREAAAAASILKFIEEELPGGFGAVVGERGVRLSGGQRQRIALARALYRRPHLLVLDEATSALDNETETQVVEAINRLQGAVTMVVVAHRLSTIEKCQFILQLNDGTGSITPNDSRSGTVSASA